MLTSNAKKAYLHIWIDGGMDDNITKQININELADAIARNLSKRGNQHDNIGFQNSSAHTGSDEDCGLKDKDLKLDRKAQEPETKIQSVPEIICSVYADDADLVELIDAFIAGLNDDVKAMRKVLDDYDYDGLRRLSHQMKGAGGSYGYQILTEAAKIVEEAAKAKDATAGIVALDKFDAYCQSVIRGREVQV